MQKSRLWILAVLVILTTFASRSMMAAGGKSSPPALRDRPR